jgi:hypothetical protein
MRRPIALGAARARKNSAYTFTEDLSSITALDNQTNVYFRLVQSDAVAANGGSIGTSGTDRVDNVIVAGDASTPVPCPPPYGFSAVVF